MPAVSSIAQPTQGSEHRRPVHPLQGLAKAFGVSIDVDVLTPLDARVALVDAIPSSPVIPRSVDPPLDKHRAGVAADPASSEQSTHSRRDWSLCTFGRKVRHLNFVGPRCQVGGSALKDNAPASHHIDTIRNGQRASNMLLDK